MFCDGWRGCGKAIFNIWWPLCAGQKVMWECNSDVKKFLCAGLRRTERSSSMSTDCLSDKKAMGPCNTVWLVNVVLQVNGNTGSSFLITIKRCANDPTYLRCPWQKSVEKYASYDDASCRLEIMLTKNRFFNACRSLAMWSSRLPHTICDACRPLLLLL